MQAFTTSGRNTLQCKHILGVFPTILEDINRKYEIKKKKGTISSFHMSLLPRYL